MTFGNHFCFVGQGKPNNAGYISCLTQRSWDLNGLRKDELIVDAFLSHEADHTVTVEEGVLPGVGEGFAELLDDVRLRIESVLMQELLGYLDSDMELMINCK